ncbi:hypothetical protein K488DRAFT_89274 [Vararia minispora EC-137]|uniref:Uncharacterized protein n=1 Tax=Vararia minispora EC-137 TaxID=1314806 RepID=A0ACB8QB02_9AGAM|nr:hypothetical protein K488DRAFT_89274 [Vararia minispora EC-137]
MPSVDGGIRCVPDLPADPPLTERKTMLVQGSIAADIRITNEHWDVVFATHLLERSFPAPIRLTIDLDNIARNWRTARELQSFLETATRDHRARICSLVVNCPGVKLDFRSILLRAQFPELRHLVIGKNLRKCALLTADGLSEAIPAATTLQVPSTIKLANDEDVDGPIFTNVVKLELIGAHATTNRSVDWDFMAVVGRLPSLKFLSLENYFPDSSPPHSVSPVILPSCMREISYQSCKSASSIMDIDALFQHSSARRYVRLRRVDARTLVQTVAGALSNAGLRLKNGELRADRTSGHLTTATIVVNSPNDYVELRIGAVLSSTIPAVYHIQAEGVDDSLAHMLACVPKDGMRDMLVVCDVPARCLWRYLGLSETLTKLHIVGSSAQEFAEVLEQDPEHSGEGTPKKCPDCTLSASP